MHTVSLQVRGCEGLSRTCLLQGAGGMWGWLLTLTAPSDDGCAAGIILGFLTAGLLLRVGTFQLPFLCKSFAASVLLRPLPPRASTQSECVPAVARCANQQLGSPCSRGGKEGLPLPLMGKRWQGCVCFLLVFALPPLVSPAACQQLLGASTCAPVHSGNLPSCCWVTKRNLCPVSPV